MKLFILSVFFVFLSTKSFSEDVNYSDYNTAGIVTFEKFKFLPLSGSKTQGVIIYSDYKKKVLGPATLGAGWQTMIIEAIPTALESEEFDTFITENNIIDVRKNIFPSNAELCELTQDAAESLYTMGIIFTINSALGGYPKACHLEIRYLTPPGSDQEKSLVDFINSNNILKIRYNLEKTEGADISFNFHEAVNSLVNLGGLKQSSSKNSYYGPIPEFTYYANKIQPSLFNTSKISLEIWQLFIKNFTFMDNTNVYVTLSDSNKIISNSSETEILFSINQTL